ncbi:hypothetical protein C5F48_09730 [Cereibacter changlensis JA139]|uniref:Uncharacterized protein n=2 Tax=Cereibacter changlensis TaxID=402884 RepID=A0A2T4JVI8_9RHOB|nr:hypothetical protein [Cereibacter changlensis]PTE21932.1 hypothetical protein C5F48_09730 [Cereibacter changlensis JA139]PZX51791.1 hypothetical protein LX76_03144 [Cereibacter changlensis]
MTEITMETLEGRLIAQRKLIALLLARLPEAERPALWEYLAERSTMQDAQEDPGAVPTAGVGLQVAIAEEFRLIAEEAQRHAGRNPQQPRVGEG